MCQGVNRKPQTTGRCVGRISLKFVKSNQIPIRSIYNFITL